MRNDAHAKKVPGTIARFFSGLVQGVEQRCIVQFFVFEGINSNFGRGNLGPSRGHGFLRYVSTVSAGVHDIPYSTVKSSLPASFDEVVDVHGLADQRRGGSLA